MKTRSGELVPIRKKQAREQLTQDALNSRLTLRPTVSSGTPGHSHGRGR
jgi:hypothetical protein